MKAVLIDGIGASPRLESVDRPERPTGTTLVRTLAVALNPIDVAVANGVFYGGHPPHPYILGSEVVGEVVESDTWPIGARLWACGGGLGTTANGCLAEFSIIGDDRAEPVPTGLSPQVAVAMGQAGLTGWLATIWRGQAKPDDTVLVLGATGSVGLAAVQAARVAGARSIIGVGRRGVALDRVRDAGATSLVQLEPGDHGATHIADRIVTAGGAPTLVIDPLWGTPGAAGILAAAPAARVVQLGQSAGASTSLTSAAIRGKQLSIFGFSVLAVPPNVRGAGYAAITREALSGRMVLDIRDYAIEEASEAWRAASTGGSGKVVVTVA